MTTIPNFADIQRTPDTVTTTSAPSASEQIWSTPEGIDVKRVFTRADRDEAAAGNDERAPHRP